MLEAQAARLGLKASVDFVGWVSPDKVPGAHEQCDYSNDTIP